MTFVIRRGGFLRRQFRFIIRGDNNRTLAASELYHNRSDVYDAIDIIRTVSSTAPIIDQAV